MRLAIISGSRKCSYCGREKPEQDFYPHNHSRCKKCLNERLRQYRKSHPDKVTQWNRVKWKKNKADKAFMAKKSARDKRLRPQKHGMTPDSYNELFAKQGGCCAICGKHQSLERKGLCIDHCHKTGVIRGLLCDRCNQGLGRFNDDAELCIKAYTYLRRSWQ